MELQHRGVLPLLIVTRAFLPLVQAQAKARRADPRLITVEHPLGGLNETELASRIDTAAAGVLRELGRLGEEAP